MLSKEQRLNLKIGDKLRLVNLIGLAASYNGDIHEYDGYNQDKLNTDNVVDLVNYHQNAGGYYFATTNQVEIVEDPESREFYKF